MTHLNAALHGLFQRELHLSRCSFPGCILEDFHDGTHQVALPAAQKPRQKVYHCVVCGRDFVIYGEHVASQRRTCGSEPCILHMASHDVAMPPLLCPCPQRSYPHELAVHRELRAESYNPKIRENLRWPWSLAASPRVELSTERG